MVGAAPIEIVFDHSLLITGHVSFLPSAKEADQYCGDEVVLVSSLKRER
jgi:hypothetical protein